MGRVKFGNGIKLALEPKIGPTVVEKEQPVINIEEIVNQVLSKLPPTETPKEVISPTQEVDLRHLATKQEIKMLLDAGESLERRVHEIASDMDELAVELDEIRHADIIIPEVQQVTHVQDVSPEVLKKCKEMLKYSEEAMMLKVNDLQKKNKTQKVINCVLSGIVILTIFLHLI